MAKMTAAQAVARLLKAVGTHRYYLYNGHANWGLLDALEYEEKIPGIRTRHELHAIHMADIEWRMRRTLPLPVTCTTVGPGNFNTIPGIAEAFYDSTPLFCLMAGGPTKWLGRGGIQEVYRYGEDEFLQLFRPITKHAVMTIRPDTALQSAMRAYKAAITGRPGPVVVYMPLDVQNTAVEIDMPDIAGWLNNIHGPGPDADAIAQAVELMAKADRPVIWAGTGVNNARAWDGLRSFAEKTKFPVATNFGAKGALPEDHPLSLGVVDRSGTGHGVRAAVEADLVVNIGARFNDLNTAGWSFYNFGKSQKLVHIDIDPSEIGRVYPVDVGIVSDAGKALAALDKAWKGTPRTAPWLASIDGWRKDWLKEVAPLVRSDLAPLHYARIVKDVSDAMNAIAPDASVICDTGFIMNFMPAFFTLKHPWFATNNQQFGQMGFAPPGVVGAGLERKGKQVVVFVGDQSFIHTGLSLATATEYGVPGVVIVLSNRTIQAEVEGAKAKFGRGVGDHYRIENTGELWNPDLGMIGEAMRAKVFKVSKPAELKPAIEAALKSGELCIVDVEASTVVPRYAVPIVLKHGTMPFPYDWNAKA
jgi:acetolactate synthase-1/2/3 large subunit